MIILWSPLSSSVLIFFMKLVATSDCSEEEKGLAIQWVSELTDELMAKLRRYEHEGLMNIVN